LLARVHEDDVATFGQALERACREGEDFAHACRLRLPDGRIKYLRVAAHAIHNDAGEVDLVGALMDVTAIALAQEQLNRLRVDLAHVGRLTTMGELTASIAHEVNQPLMAIVTNAESCLLWLKRQKPNLDKARNAAERIVKNGHRASSVIKSIRSLARKAAPEIVVLDINSLIAETLELMQYELRRKEIALEIRLLDTPQSITGDRIQLQQVIVNLVLNAIEAMSVTALPARVLRILTEYDENRNVLISVQDSGSGLDPTNLDRIFDPLFTTKPNGMGLGLSICRSIVESHGGRLWASPNPRGGSIFSFTLPQATS
jgi:C4-dicarboxylate-specific signal transduction histidine kinase